MLFAGAVSLSFLTDASAAEVDAFDSAAGDRLDACQDKIAHSFRYDFNHVEIPTAEQAIEAFHLYCRDEIGAMRAFVPNWSTTKRDGETIGDRVDDSALASFSNAENDIWEQEHSTRPPPTGTDSLTDHMRWSVFFHPSLLSADEIAYVYRQDAFGFDPDVSFHGSIGSWTYSYYPNPSSGTPAQRWNADMEGPDTKVWINCDSLGPPGRACTILFSTRGFPKHDYLALQAGGVPFGVQGVCNPGGTGIVLDAPQPDNIDSRHATLTVDNQSPIILPDGSGCVADKDGSLALRTLAAHKFRSSFAPPFRERVIDNDGQADALRPALKLAEQTYEATRGATGHLRAIADIAVLSDRAAPYTVGDALGPYPEWARARDCLIEQVGKAGRSGDLTLAAAMGNERCRDQLEDLDWRAAEIGAPISQWTNLDPLSITGAKSRIAAARNAMASEISHRLQSGAKSFSAPRSFTESEREATVVGHHGSTGFASRTAFGVSPVAYGYFLSDGISQGAVAGPFDRYGEADGTQHAFATIVVRCRAHMAPRCTMRIPFESGSGYLRIETDGGRAGSKVCVEARNRSWGDWKLSALYSGTPEWDLNADHCIDQSRSTEFMRFLDHSSVRLRAPGEPNNAASRRVGLSSLVMALTSFLSSSVTETH
jgi:hypothetical protein